MAITINWSTTLHGTHTSSVSWSDITKLTPGTQQLFLEHTGTNEISECAYYIKATPSYEADYAEILGWGDDDDDHTLGGLALSQDYDTFASYTLIKTGQGTLASPIVMDADSIDVNGVDDGVLPSGSSSCTKWKIVVPTAETVGGTRRFTTTFTYTYTT